MELGFRLRLGFGAAREKKDDWKRDGREHSDKCGSLLQLKGDSRKGAQCAYVGVSERELEKGSCFDFYYYFFL